MSFRPEDSQGTQEILSKQDVVLAADSEQNGAGDIVFKTGGVERARIDFSGIATGLFGGFRIAKYLLVSDGVTVTAYDKSQTVVSSGTDGGAVLTACLPVAASAGALIEFRNDGNVFPWSTVPALPNGITNKLLIRGNGVLVQLSAAAPRFLDLARTADYQTFQHIEVTDFVVDATNATAANTHTIFGSRTGVAASDQRINFLDITLRRIRCFGGPTTGSRRGVYFAISQLAGGEGTQNTGKDILLEDVWVDGCQHGFSVLGTPAGAITNLNILFDNVRIVRCKHTQAGQAVVGAVGSAANIQIGMNAPVGYVLVRDFFGEYSGDVGIEVDNATEADIEDCVISNAQVAYLTTNFATPTKPNAQSVTYRRCRATVSDATVAQGNQGFSIAVNNSLAVGNVTYDGCVFEQDNNVLGTASAKTPYPFGLLGTGLTVRQLSLLNCKATIEGINWNNAANTNPINILGVVGATIGLLKIRDLDIRGSGTIAGAGLVAARLIELQYGNVQMQIDGVNIDWNITGQGANSVTRGMVFGGTNGLTLGGSIRGVKVVALGSDTGGSCLRFVATGQLTISPGPVTIEDCDFTLMSASTEILCDATQTALGAILTHNNRWKTKPAPVALTGLVTATGKVLGASGAIWQSVAVFTQGSGAAITAIDFSTNGGTTYTNKLTQASAALPAGFDQDIGPLNPADLIKATFTTTQPTITLVPVNP